MDQNFRLKLADFGWSRQKETERTTFCGTPDYLSPEMINGTEQTEKLDIWTMGILMFELLHGKAPFSLNKKFSPRNKLQEIQRDILRGEITFARGISEEAQEIIRAMMDPDPPMRPSAYELLTFPFFTTRYPFLASLNVKNSFINSKFFNKSKMTHSEKENSFVNWQNNASNINRRREELAQREQQFQQKQDEFEKEKSDFYKRVIELDKLKEEFRERQIAKDAQFSKQRESLYRRAGEFEKQRELQQREETRLADWAEQLERDKQRVAHKEQELEEQWKNHMDPVDKE